MLVRVLVGLCVLALASGSGAGAIAGGASPTLVLVPVSAPAGWTADFLNHPDASWTAARFEGEILRNTAELIVLSEELHEDQRKFLDAVGLDLALWFVCPGAEAVRLISEAHTAVEGLNVAQKWLRLREDSEYGQWLWFWFARYAPSRTHPGWDYYAVNDPHKGAAFNRFRSRYHGTGACTRIYTLTIVNTNTDAGAVEGIGAPPPPISCGGSSRSCSARVPAYNGRELLVLTVYPFHNDWKIANIQTCDEQPGYPNSRAAQCGIKMTGDRTVTVTWQRVPQP